MIDVLVALAGCVLVGVIEALVVLWLFYGGSDDGER